MNITEEQQRELATAHHCEYTNRTTVPAMEARMGEIIPMLDYGFIRLVDYMGSDASVVQAARVSYGSGTKKVSDDRGLIRYLVRNRHTTPLEMCEIKLHVKMPIFVARQWIRHRTASVNEVSARYSVLDEEFYVPALEDMGIQDNKNRQGRGEAVGDYEGVAMQGIIAGSSKEAYKNYTELLDHGLARELSRSVLPVNFYTSWYWKIDLHNLLHFLSLRMDSHAQKEVRVYADAIGKIVKDWVPTVWEAFEDYRLNARMLSGQEVEIIKVLLKNYSIGYKNYNGENRNITEPLSVQEIVSKLSKREVDDLYKDFDIDPLIELKNLN